MGTNYYYFAKPACEACGRSYPRVHIGKSSAGWEFLLRALDRQDTWRDMKNRLLLAEEIWNEYDERKTAQEVIDLVESKATEKNAAADDQCTWRDPDGFVMCDLEFS